MNARRITPEDGQRALRGHVVERALLARRRHGCPRDEATFLRVLADREVVRYPTAIAFDAAGLEPGEFGHAEPFGAGPAEGFRLLIHPRFRDRAGVLPLLAAYHIPSINYGEIATCEEAELFGATLLGLEVDDYYRALCELAGELDEDRQGPGEAP
jgi:hypothetical protein